ncbi:translation initiation factor [Burkholderia phage vB_BglM_WTB]
MDGIRKGDIVKFQEAPAEILTVDKDAAGDPIFFLINKKTLFGHFAYPNEFEFVRRPKVRGQ